MSIDELTAKFEAAGQGHVTAGLAGLGQEQQAQAIAQLQSIDPVHVNSLYERMLAWKPPEGNAFEPLSDIAPLAGSTEQRAAWRVRGLAEIAAGRVGTLLLAGGQGSRLGFDHPKGMYDIGLPSGRTLFALQAHRLFKVQDLAAKAAGQESATVMW